MKSLFAKIIATLLAIIVFTIIACLILNILGVYTCSSIMEAIVPCFMLGIALAFTFNAIWRKRAL